MFALVRHAAFAAPARVPSAHSPFGLTSEGFEQARRIAPQVLGWCEQLGVGVGARLLCSPLRRAYETAATLRDELALSGVHVDIEEHSALAERSLGAGANLTEPDIEALLAADPRYGAPPPGWRRDPDYRLPWLGAESWRDAGRRVAALLRERSERGPTRALEVVIGHGGAFRHAAAALGALGSTPPASLTLGHGRGVVLASLTAIDPEPPRGFEIVCGNFQVRTTDGFARPPSPGALDSVADDGAFMRQARVTR